MDKVKLSNPPRMADFAEWVTACEPAMPWAPGEFLRRYEANLSESAGRLLDSSPLVLPLQQAMAGRTQRSVTAKELLAVLNRYAGDATCRLRSWPKSPRDLSGMLQRLASSLRTIGLDVTWAPERTNRGRIITIERTPPRPSQRSQPSPNRDDRGPSDAEETTLLDQASREKGVIPATNGHPRAAAGSSTPTGDGGDGRDGGCRVPSVGEGNETTDPCSNDAEAVD